jgi:hypothetical protein
VRASREKPPLILRPVLTLNLTETIVADQEASVGNIISIGRRRMKPNGWKMRENHALKSDGLVDVNDMILLNGGEEMKGTRETSISSAEFNHSMRTGSSMLEDEPGVVEIAKGCGRHRVWEGSNPEGMRVPDCIVHRTERHNLREGQACVGQNPSEIRLSECMGYMLKDRGIGRMTLEGRRE